MQMQGERVALSAGKRQRQLQPKFLAGCHESLRQAKQDGILQDSGRFAEHRLRAGELVESRWFELLVVLLVVMMLVMSVTAAGIEYKYICIQGVECGWKNGLRASVLLSYFESIGQNIVIFFFLEMFVKIVIGQLEFFKNPWQVLDLVVVGINYISAFDLDLLAMTINYTSSSDLTFLFEKNVKQTARVYAGLLMALRCWRLVKIYCLVKEEHEAIEYAGPYVDQEESTEVVNSAARELCRQYGAAVPAWIGTRPSDSSPEAASLFRFVVAPWPSKESFDSIAAYRYNVFETPTPLVRWVSTTCDKIVLRLPDWLSPNAISVIGVVPFLINAAVLCATCEMDGPAPAWLLVTSAMTFAWQELCDNCDGKQARRLGCGSPLGSMVDHTFDAIASLPVMWVMNLVLQYPPHMILVTQAVAVVYGVVLPWSERFKGYFPIYLVCDYCFAFVTAWILGAVVGPAEFSKQLVYSPIDVNIVSLRAVLFGMPVAIITAYHIISTLLIAKKDGKLAFAVGQVLPQALVIPATLMWKEDIAVDYFRYLSVVLGALVVVYHLKEIVKTMSQPHYEEGYLLDKPLMVAYIVIASVSQLMPSFVLAKIVPVYAILSVVVAATYVCAVFNSVATRLGIARIFLVPDRCRAIPKVANEACLL